MDIYDFLEDDQLVQSDFRASAKQAYLRPEIETGVQIVGTRHGTKVVRGKKVVRR